MFYSIDEQLDSLAATIGEALKHFQIWEALQEAHANADDVGTMNRYREFFQPTVLAHFHAYVVACYRLFETRSDTVSFPSLKRALKKVEDRDIDDESELKRLQLEMGPIWKRILRIRNESVGHFSNERSQHDVFARAGLSPQDVENFIGLAIQFHRGITLPRKRGRVAFDADGKRSTRRLLDDLKLHAETPPSSIHAARG